MHLLGGARWSLIFVECTSHGGDRTEKNNIRAQLLERALALPSAPGVYIMRNADREIIYVGKSRKLCARVSQYFRNGEKNRKTERMVANVHTFDTILVANEAEALTLENELIKQHKPRFNIRLKDSKSYPYIKVTVNEEYPRVLYTRQREADGARYFGPFPDQTAARNLLNTLYKVIGVPECKRVFPRDIGSQRPCIYRDMNRCIAPCAGDVPPQVYRTVIDEAVSFLSGNTAQVRRSLIERMTEAAEEERYEAAARYRDAINALDALKQKQKVVGSPDDEFDIVAAAGDDCASVVTVMAVRGGAIASKEDFVFSGEELFDYTELTSFVLDYYTMRGCPSQVLMLTEEASEDVCACAELLSGVCRHKVSISVPKRGSKHDLCMMARKNAEDKLRETVRTVEADNSALVRLAALLGLEVIPDRIEAYDISNYGNEQIYGAMVCSVNGRFSRSDYRVFRCDDGQDDYACMRSVVYRRLSHNKAAGDGAMPDMPDLILIDGGAAHVNAARDAAREAGVMLPIIGMVKDEHHKTRALTDGESEIGIARETAVYRLIYRIQEEVHRFAISKSGGGKRKSLRRSSLEDINGIGKTKAKRLLEYFGGLQGVKKASLEELIASNIGITAASAVRLHFHPEDEEQER